MYTVKCDDYHLLDVRDDELILINPKVKIEVNTVGEGSFTIYANHPFYDKLNKLKSIFEVADEIGVIFRGRMTEDTRDFYNGKAVDLEGVMAFFNDSSVAPFNFPDDFLEDADYIAAAESGNVVEFLLNWLIENHNSQVQEFQKFQLGNVTVSDPNNFITRSSEEIANTWETLKSKLFESGLGGYLCIRYEDDGNYIDYLSEFTLTNTQRINFGENLLDMKQQSDASTTYSAIIPIGAEVEIVVATETGGESTDSETEGDIETEPVEPTTERKRITLESVPDGFISDDVYKITLENGLHALYSQQAVEDYGWICAPVSDTTWDDVTEVQNLVTKGKTWLLTQGVMLADTVEITAADLHFTDEEIQSFRIYRKVIVDAEPQGISQSFNLTVLDIPLLEPQNTKITVGETRLTLTDKNNNDQLSNVQRIENIKNELKGLEATVEGIEGKFFYIKYSAYADGHVMTDVPDENTMYMGTCSTNQETAPTDHTQYIWVKVGGEDGQDAILLMIDSSAGNLFKNSNIATTLTVTIIVGDISITDSTRMKQVFGNSAKLKWQQMNMGESEFTDIAEDDNRLSDNGFILTLNAADISTKAIFNCTLDF